MMEAYKIPMNLRAAYLSMHRQTNAHLARFGVTADQFVCLLILAEEVDPALGLTTAGLTAVAAAMWLGCRTDVYCPIRTLLHRTSAAAVR